MLCVTLTPSTVTTVMWTTSSVLYAAGVNTKNMFCTSELYILNFAPLRAKIQLNRKF